MPDLDLLLERGGLPLLALLLIASWCGALIISEGVALLLRLRRPPTSLPILGALAACAPLVGLLGTVMGLVRIFAASTAPEAMAAGIAQALLTTQVGLIIAVPALLLRQVLLRWRERRVLVEGRS